MTDVTVTDVTVFLPGMNINSVNRKVFPIGYVSISQFIHNRGMLLAVTINKWQSLPIITYLCMSNDLHYNFIYSFIPESFTINWC